jgi:peptidyl-tRNA hydrolase
VAILDKIENTANGITTTVTVTAQGITSTVTDYYNQGIVFYNQQRENAVEKGNVFVATANRPVNQLLDYTETIVNRILPPETPYPPLEGSDEEEDEKEPYEETSDQDINDDGEAFSIDTTDAVNSRLASNPLPRIRQMGTGVSKRLHNVAMSKLQNINLRTQAQIESLTHVVNLIQYAADYIDLDGKTKTIKDNVSHVHNYIEEKKEEANARYVNPAREIIEQQTADIKEQGIRSVVAVVSTIAHLTEVIRRQIANNVPNLTKLQAHLREITSRTKEAILKLNGPELSNYISMVRDKYKLALHSIIELTSTYIPAKVIENFPILAHLSSSLSTWKQSLTTRLPLDHVQYTKNEEIIYQSDPPSDGYEKS